MLCAAASVGAQTSGSRTITPRNAEPAAGTPEQAEIQLFLRDWEEASFKGDKTWYERHYADSFIKTGQRGDVVDKRNQIESMTTDPITKVDSSAVDDLYIQTFGHVAVATFRVTIKGTTATGPYNVNSRATTVFVKTNGVWQIVAHHATNIAPVK
jgi:ketosteroid isomerase-like protein